MTTALDQDSFAWSQAILNEHTKFAEPVETFEPMLRDTVNVLPYIYIADLGKIFAKLVSTKNSDQPIFWRIILKNCSQKIQNSTKQI